MSLKISIFECDFQQSSRAGSEQQIVKKARVLQSQHIQLVRHGEHNVEVGVSRSSRSHAIEADVSIADCVFIAIEAGAGAHVRRRGGPGMIVFAAVHTTRIRR